MNTKRLGLTAFFIILTLSIGMVSINQPLSKTYAQNNALSQDGNSNAEIDIKQGQSAEQDGQVVTGDTSVLSGNNILCQNQGNSGELPVLNDLCSLGQTNPPSTPPPPNGETGRLTFRIANMWNTPVQVIVNWFQGSDQFQDTQRLDQGAHIFGYDVPVDALLSFIVIAERFDFWGHSDDNKSICSDRVLPSLTTVICQKVMEPGELSFAAQATFPR